MNEMYVGMSLEHIIATNQSHKK